FTARALDGKANFTTDYFGVATVSVTDPRASAPAQVSFGQGGQTSFSVTFSAPGTQTVTLADARNSNIRGSATIVVTPAPVAASTSGGCGSTGGVGFSTLFGLALILRRRKGREDTTSVR